MPRESTSTSRRRSRDRDWSHRDKERDREGDRSRYRDHERDGDRERRPDQRDRERRVDRKRDERKKRFSRSRSAERSKDRRKLSRSSSRGRFEKPRKRSHEETRRKTKSRSKSRKRSGRSKSSSSSSSEASSSSTSSADSTESLEATALELKLIEKRAEAAQRRKLEKQRRKMMETPEEKRARRLLKKDMKERSRKAKMGWDSEYLHYTNSDNPFGDSNLLDNFYWKKKLEKEGVADLPLEELERRKRQKMEENRKELEKVKERRLAMEKEREDREQDIWAMQRSKEADQFKEWHKQEELFHLDQAKLRSKIRIQDGRAKPIDLLAKYISAQEDVDAVEMHEPYTYLTGLGIDDLEDLLEDIKVYQELEREVNQNFWDDMTIIVNDELIKLRRAKSIADAEAHGATHAERIERPGVHSSVAKDVADVFRGKTPEQLEQLKESIAKKVADKKSGPPGGRADLPYWESLLQQLHAYMARARLREAHQANLRKKLEMLKAQQGVEEAEKAAAAAANTGDQSGSDEEYEGEEGMDSSIVEAALNDYEEGRYSPEPVEPNDLELGTIFVSEEDDAKRLEYSRQMVLNKGRKIENVMTAEERALHREARKGMTDDEATFAVEADIEQQSYLWSDKYRPRKPRYFNRVHTGFEWNKYNQTHYDMDNPPPKIVQGYKFNIFFPDLLDKSTTPSYSITPCTDKGDFAILRFKAGPPYEDIAFKIVNREWEYSYRRGFRCQFHNSIFQLWFHFKRYRYRR